MARPLRGLYMLCEGDSHPLGWEELERMDPEALVMWDHQVANREGWESAELFYDPGFGHPVALVPGKAGAATWIKGEWHVNPNVPVLWSARSACIEQPSGERMWFRRR